LLKSLSTISIPAFFPIHPRTKKMISNFRLWNEIPENIILSDPVGYFDLLSLIKQSQFVITDSGGVQREAAYFSRPVYLARPETEWIELAKSGAVKVSGYEFDVLEYFDEKISYKEIAYLFRPAAKAMAENMNSVFSEK